MRQISTRKYHSPSHRTEANGNLRLGAFRGLPDSSRLDLDKVHKCNRHLEHWFHHVSRPFIPSKACLTNQVEPCDEPTTRH